MKRGCVCGDSSRPGSHSPIACHLDSETFSRVRSGPNMNPMPLGVPSARDQRILDAVGPDYFGSDEHSRDLQDAVALYPDQDLPSYHRRMGYCVGAATARKRQRE